MRVRVFAEEIYGGWDAPTETFCITIPDEFKILDTEDESEIPDDMFERCLIACHKVVTQWGNKPLLVCGVESVETGNTLAER